jgi:methylmalonyl-CoA/ethylmalonyl-CoA epimerase
MEKIEHIGIAVASLEDGQKLFSALLGKEPYKIESVDEEGVVTVFYQMGDSKVELVIPSRVDSPVSRFLEKRGPGLHHVAFAVQDIRSEMNRLRDSGFQLITDEPYAGADQKEVVFIHPKSTGGLLVELCADR